MAEVDDILGCSVGGCRTKPSLLTEYRQVQRVDGQLAADAWLWQMLMERHGLGAVNKRAGWIMRILGVGT